MRRSPDRLCRPCYCNADALSRLPLKEVSPEETSSDPCFFNISQMEVLPVTIRRLRAATGSDQILSKVYRYLKGTWPSTIPSYLRPYFDRRNKLTVEEGCVLWGFRVVIPHSLRETLLSELSLKSVARSYMSCPGWTKPLKMCQSCQTVNGALPIVPLHPWTCPSKPRVHLDFAGPFHHVLSLC